MSQQLPPASFMSTGTRMLVRVVVDAGFGRR
jgi:hypothetical protein